MSEYTGTDNLEAMKLAVNYNQSLKELVINNTKKSDIVMDFGAGIGTFAKEIHDEGYDVHCIELDENQFNIIKDQGLKVNRHLEEIEDASIDTIYSLNVLEHIKDDSQIIAELKKKLKSGGKILIYVPALMILYSSMDKKVGHYRRYTARMLKDLAFEHDLKIKTLRYVDSLGFFATLLYKLIGSKDGSLNLKSLIFYDRIIFPIAQFLDIFFFKLFGKNVYVLLEKK